MRFYGQWNPPVDQFLFENYFKDKEDGFFIECGAFDGVMECCCKFFEEFKGWTGVNIEPVPEVFDNLCANRPESTNVRAALSDKNATATFKQAIHPRYGNHFGNGSISHTDSHKNSLVREGCKFEEYEVDTITFSKLIQDLEIKHIDLFVLDVEGHELSVLEGMKGCPVMPDIMCVEHGHLGDQLNKAMSDLGYKFDKKSHNNSFYTR